ncbi:MULTISPECIES: hypothetical protein [unclassified Mesorhizobium]|uniref:hypothetical protein n=1 Tax=unclassified Mesorhizobium TaxID=325217 RepID=UPI00142EAB68|nr:MULTISPECIES: hypothetical protein [unclassified Mesorhizobium]
MAIKFSAKEQPAPAATKPAKPAAAPQADKPLDVDLLGQPPQKPPRKTRKK